jgi:hypothetical protein
MIYLLSFGDELKKREGALQPTSYNNIGKHERWSSFAVASSGNPESKFRAFLPKKHTPILAQLLSACQQATRFVFVLKNN